MLWEVLAFKIKINHFKYFPENTMVNFGLKNPYGDNTSGKAQIDRAERYIRFFNLMFTCSISKNKDQLNYSSTRKERMNY